MDKITLFIPYPENPKEKTRWAREYSLNRYYAGKHWTKRQKDAEFWHSLTKKAVYDAFDYRPPLPAEQPVMFRFYWNSKLDLDNNSAMGKMIVDGLKGILIKDDNRKHVIGISHYFHDENYIKIEIEEIDA